MRLSVAVLIAVTAGPALGADLEVASDIDRVTVYPNGAFVTRTASFDLPAGISKVTLRALPPGLEPDSIQVSAKGSGNLLIGPVTSRLERNGSVSPPASALQERIAALTEERDILATRIEALNAKKAAIELFGTAGPGSLGVDGKPFDVSQWQGAWDAVGNGLRSTLEDLRQAKHRHDALASEIAAAENARRADTGSSGDSWRDVTVEISADERARGDLTVSYRVPGASWRPIYEARLETGEPKPSLRLVRRAEIKQWTGENWSNVALSVSTVRIGQRTAAIEPTPLQIRLSAPPIPIPGTQIRVGRDQTQAFRFSGGGSSDNAREKEAILDAGSFQATYGLPDRATVSQDGVEKTFALASRTVVPSLSVRATPEIDPTAYLTASFTQEDEAPFLPGVVFLNRDGVFVGTTNVRQTVPGDAIDLGFGADDRVKITRVPVRRRESGPTWLGKSKTDLRVFKTTVRNLHTEPVQITVFDRLPYSEDATLTVDQLPDTTVPTEKEPNDRRGILAWTYDYKAGEQKDIRLSYRLTWPSDRELAPPPAAGSGGRF